MLLTVLAIGGTILGATTVAGLLMLYQVRQTTDFALSAKAVFAADAGIEWGLYRFFKFDSLHPEPVFSNGASFRTTCYTTAQLTVDCGDESTVLMRAIGTAPPASRAFELSFQ